MKHRTTRRPLARSVVTMGLFLVAVYPMVAQIKAALVIGNQAYRNVTPLRNPVNDATDVAAALRSLGFQVDLLTNASLPEMERQVVRLKSLLSGSSDAVGFFYYAGHGVQSDGVNYLIPADADILDEAFLRTKALAVQSVLDALQGARNRLNVVVLDACRDNPFSWARSGGRGLTVVGQQPPGSVIVYATSAGSVAQDGTGRNGVFTGELLKNLKVQGLEIQEVFRRTGAGVQAVTRGAQTPAVYSQFFGQYYLVGGAVESAASTPEMILVDGGAFLMGDTFGDGESDEKPVHSVTVSSFLMARTEVTVGEFRRFVEETGYKTTAEREGGGRVFNGILVTQESDASWMNPYFVWYAGRPQPVQVNAQPVVLVSWFDAAEYCNWLSRKEGFSPFYTLSGTNVSMNWAANGYRLPTEAEWEYAARGGRSSRGTEYAGSANPDAVAWYSSNAQGQTRPVATKAANEIGLFDMSGNVWEWCNDWYTRYTTGAQADPRGPESGTHRVIRGGSWLNDANEVRTAYRGFYGGRNESGGGFRLVRRAS